MPLNRHLWTSSMILWAGGWSFLLLAAFHAAIDLAGCRRLAFPFVVVGVNALLALHTRSRLRKVGKTIVWHVEHGGWRVPSRSSICVAPRARSRPLDTALVLYRRRCFSGRKRLVPLECNIGMFSRGLARRVLGRHPTQRASSPANGIALLFWRLRGFSPRRRFSANRQSIY